MEIVSMSSYLKRKKILKDIEKELDKGKLKTDLSYSKYLSSKSNLTFKQWKRKESLLFQKLKTTNKYSRP